MLNQGAEEADFVFEIGGVGGRVVEWGVEDDGEVGVEWIVAVRAAEHQWRCRTRVIEGTAKRSNREWLVSCIGRSGRRGVHVHVLRFVEVEVVELLLGLS